MQLDLSTTQETVGKIAGCEEQINTFKQERETVLRCASEMVMKIANKQKTKESGHVGEVHVRMRIRLKKPQKGPTSILRAQLTVEQLEGLWSLRSMVKIGLTSALLLLVAVLMAINKGQQEGFLVRRDEDKYFETYNGVGNSETAGRGRENGERAAMNL